MWPGHNGPNVFLYESKATIPKKSNTITIMIMNVINSAFSPAYLSTLWQWRANTGVLVAISIPIFTSQLEKSRDAVSVANIRAAYAEAASAYLTESDGGNATVNKTAKTATVTKVALKGTQSGWSDLDSELPFTHTSMTAEIGGAAGEYTLVFTFDDAGACTLTSLDKK